MYLCFFCIGAIYYVIILVIYFYSSTFLAFVRACILKSVFEAPLCPVRVGGPSVFFSFLPPLFCCAFLFPCISILLLFAVFTIWQKNVFSQEIYWWYSCCCMFCYVFGREWKEIEGDSKKDRLLRIIFKGFLCLLDRASC